MVLIIIFGGTVQGTELINIEFYTKYVNFIDEVPVCCWRKRISKQNISKVLAGVLVSQWRVTELKKLTEILDSYKTPGFHMIVTDSSQMLGLLVNCSAIVVIIWKQNFPFC